MAAVVIGAAVSRDARTRRMSRAEGAHRRVGRARRGCGERRRVDGRGRGRGRGEGIAAVESEALWGRAAVAREPHASRVRDAGAGGKGQGEQGEAHQSRADQY